MAIQPNDGPTIVPKYSLSYSPETFAEQKDPRFVEVSAHELLTSIKPNRFDFLPGRQFISADTETFFTGVPTNRLPSTVVRRWIQRGSKNIPNDFPFCVSVCDGTNAFVVYDTIQNQFKEFKKLEELLCDTSVDKIFHNVTYDMHMLANARIDMKGRLHDTLILSKLTRPDAFTHSLLDIAKHLGNGVVKFEHMLNDYKAQYRITDYRQFPTELMTQYTCADVWNAMAAFEELYPIMVANKQEKLYGIESQILVIAFNMERNGVLMDQAYLEELIPALEQEVNDAEREIYDAAGTTFNINSNLQLYDVLCRLGYGSKVKIKKETGNPVFNKFQKERLANEGVPLIEKIQEFEKASRLLNTFALKLQDMQDFEHLVHCNINTVEAKTSRFSISNPSMQNMPRRKDSRVRGAFIAPEGYALYDFDFKAQESFILLHYSRAQYLLDLVKDGVDIHVAFASIIFDVALADVTKDMRNTAKSIEFAIVYGAGADKVAAMTGISVDEARMRMSEFMRRVPEVDMFIRTANKVAKERGCVKTILGWITATEHGREYACVNYVIQGSAAGSTKSRMIDIYRYLKSNGYKSRMLIQVHDSLLNKIADNEEHIIGKLRWLQTDRDLFRVTINVDVAKCSPTWRDKADIEVAATEPTEQELENMNNYDIWSEGLFAL